jgi:hypothetical protein
MTRISRIVALACCFTGALAAPVLGEGLESDQRVADIIRSGKLRIGVFPSFQYANDQPQSLALNIAKAVATRLGNTDVVAVEFPTPPQVIACVKAGECDIGFMLIDPARAMEVDFTPAFVRFRFHVPGAGRIDAGPRVRCRSHGYSHCGGAGARFDNRAPKGVQAG